MLSFVKQLIKQFFKKPATNPFPTKHVPRSFSKLMERVKKGKATLNKPIDVPEGFRGRLVYDEKKCIRCLQCVRICPAKALEFDKERNVIKHYVARCTFCGQCVDICPVKALRNSKQFLLADFKKDAGFLSPEEAKELNV